VVGGVLVSLFAVLLSPLASASPDGLERVAKDMGFLHLEQSAPFQILPGYTIPFLGQTPLSTIIAGAVGALVVLGLMIVIGKSLRQRKA
jgi:cobalt/nickel transport system permease protein